MNMLSAASNVLKRYLLVTTVVMSTSNVVVKFKMQVSEYYDIFGAIGETMLERDPFPKLPMDRPNRRKTSMSIRWPAQEISRNFLLVEDLSRLQKTTDERRNSNRFEFCFVFCCVSEHLHKATTIERNVCMLYLVFCWL